MMSNSHYEALGMIFDDLGCSMTIFRNHGAKHSPPGDRCPPEWSEGVPPVGIPVTPLI